MRINTLFSTYFTTCGTGYACQSILEHMQRGKAEILLHCIAKDNKLNTPFYRVTLPSWGKPMGFRIFSIPQLTALTEWKYKRSLRSDDIAYIWPGASVSALNSIRKQSIVTVIENINTHQKVAKSILDDEYCALGMKPEHAITEESIEREQLQMEMADYVFCPSEEVALSLINCGVPERKILRTSYGLGKKDILPLESIIIRNNREVRNAIFVGRIGVRKGVHLLLESWVKADVKGVLKLVGNIEESFRHYIEPFLALPNIIHIPFVDDLSTIFKEADLFLLPSLEEGSPLVTYLAMGAGLPSIVSSMGGGGIIHHRKEGLVIDPHDTDVWAEAIRQLFSDSLLRQELAYAAYEKAPHFLWGNIGRQRLDLLTKKLGGSV